MNKRTRKVIAAVLCLMMLLSAVPLTGLAASFDTAVTGDYYSIISKHEYTLAPGATETEIVLNNAQGTRRQIAHVMEIDTKNPTIQVLPGYYGIDKLDPDNLNDSTHWTDARVTETVKYYEEKLGYNVVGAMNTALAYDSNAPYDFMVYNGVVLADPANHTGNAQTYLAIKENGDCELRSRTEALEADDYNVIAANFSWLVKDGNLVTKTPERTTAAASRSMLGIKADGTLVIAQFDGRVSPIATGLSNYEMGEMMLALGCVNAVNGDGGGSSTFVTRREGEETHTMRSIPSDGSERPTINSIVVVSTASATGIFDHSVINSEYDFFAAGSSYGFTAQGIDTAGFEMDIPAEVTWALSDASFGTIENGVFTATGKTGKVDVQMIYNGAVVGSKTIEVVIPGFFGFSAESTVIPYGKTITLDVVATYGSDNTAVYLGDQVAFQLSDSTAATIQGTELKATTDESKKGVNVTATYLFDTTMTSTLEVVFGKGSEIIYDFEDGDTAGFMGFQDAKKWSQENGVNNTLVGSDPLAGQFSEQVSSKTFVSSEVVRNGEKALAWSVDYTDSAFAGWTYNVLFNVGETIVLRDVANGKNATTLGMWLYIPEGATGLAFQSQFYAKNADGTYSCKQDHFMFTTVSGVSKNLNSCTEADIPESRWVYASIDISKYDYLCTPVATDVSNSRSPSFIRTYIKPAAPAVHTFYIDDITLDYSAAVDDRVLPTISNVSYATQDESVALAEGTVIDGNSIAFSASIADNTKLDYTTAQILVDGNALTNVSASGSVLATTENVVLTSGVHTVTFQVKDQLGNLAKVTRTITVAGDAVITLAGHNDGNSTPEYDSLYYVDVKAADLADIQKLTTTLKLQTANNWEPQGISAAKGFKVSYTLNENADEITLVIERNGAAIDADASVLVSVPVRLWSWNGFDSVTEKPVDRETQFKTGNNPIVTIDCKVLVGTVEFVSNKAFGAFGGKISVATMMNDSVNPWHYHDAELTVLETEATCDTDGFTGRTYCQSCQSVIDWGTITPATGHIFSIIDGVLSCKCGEVFTGDYEGLYYVNGLLANGWVGNSYYVDGLKLTGIQTIDGYYYDFGTDGICADQVKYSGLIDMDGVNYYAIGGKLVGGWQQIGEDWYCFDSKTFAAFDGENYNDSGVVFQFDNGRVVEGTWTKTKSGYRYWYGPSYYKKFTASATHDADPYVINGKTYFFNRQGYMQTGVIPYKDTLLQMVVYYDCGTDGVANLLTGVYNDYFYADGIRQNNYKLVQSSEGDFYFIDAGHKVARSKTIYLSQKFVEGHTYADGTALPEGNYTFDAQGKMIIKNGPVDGYFFVNNVRQNNYKLVEFEGNFYFIDAGHKLAKNTKLYLGQKFVDGHTFADGTALPEGYYDFDAEGKMILSEGIIGNYLYHNNARLNAYQLVNYEGSFYFINDGHKLAKSMKLYLSQKFVAGHTYADGSPLTEGYYNFDAEGKMEVLNGPVNGYFYINNVRQNNYKLVQFEGNFYFIDAGHRLAKNTKLYLSQKFVAGHTYADGTPLTEGYYNFDAEGKMEVIDGVVGNYMYRNNSRLNAYQMVNYEGNYYFIGDGNKVAKSCTIYISEKFVAGHTYADGTPMPAGYYTFDAEGKMVGKNGPVGDYFYRNDVKLLAYQLVEFEGNFYFIGDGNKIAKNTKVYLSAKYVAGKTFEDGTMVEVGYHNFDAEGKMVN